MRWLSALLLLAAVDVGWSYVQFQHTLVPATDEDKGRAISTQRATYGHFVRQRFNKVARTGELHNCVLPGCTLMGEVLDIRQTNMTRYDAETYKTATRTVTNKKGKKTTVDAVRLQSGIDVESQRAALLTVGSVLACTERRRLDSRRDYR